MSESDGSWRLGAGHDVQTQGLVVSGFAHLPCGRALLLRQDQPGRDWLKALQAVAPVTPADGARDTATAIAFTHSGLRMLGVDAAGPAAAPDPFREGMLQPDRVRRLGDRFKDAWTETVVPGGPAWSGNPDGDALRTPETVHAFLALYAADEAAADALATTVMTALAPHGIVEVRRFALLLRPDEKGVFREHFGFSDGMSQPLPYDAEFAAAGGKGASATVVDPAGAAYPPDPVHAVPLGEILFGHMNGHREHAPGPSLNGDAGLALDGSYLVVRELRQDVAGFWRSMEAAAAKIAAADPDAHLDADNLAARVIGRTRDGELLRPGGILPASDNAFLFHEQDPDGAGCPMGSHVRRANPRDGLATKPGQEKILLDAANRHRILRRARKFGPPLERGAPDDGAARGLLFMALNTDIQRQFEFIQQTWLLNPNFARLYDESDPLVGPAGPMTLRDRALRRIVEVETYVRFAGGEYFFLPGLPALAWLTGT